MDEEHDEMCRYLDICTRPHDWRTGKHVPSSPKLSEQELAEKGQTKRNTH